MVPLPAAESPWQQRCCHGSRQTPGYKVSIWEAGNATARPEQPSAPDCSHLHALIELFKAEQALGRYCGCSRHASVARDARVPRCSRSTAVHSAGTHRGHLLTSSWKRPRSAAVTEKRMQPRFTGCPPAEATHSYTEVGSGLSVAAGMQPLSCRVVCRLVFKAT